MIIYVDATFDKVTRISFVGYCDSSMTVTKVLKRRFNDINVAEVYALELAIDDLGNDHDFYSDSIYAVEKLARNNVYHITRSKNLADTLVSTAKESFKSKSFWRKKNDN